MPRTVIYDTLNDGFVVRLFLEDGEPNLSATYQVRASATGEGYGSVFEPTLTPTQRTQLLALLTAIKNAIIAREGL